MDGGEELLPTGLTYREWLEWLMRARGTDYWLKLATEPDRGRRTWVEDGLAWAAARFPDFAPEALRPRLRRMPVR